MLPAPFANAYVLTGPTGSGKTALGIGLAALLDAEIISMDSMALYRGMDIATAKPAAGQRAQVRHHLIDVLDPWESGSVAWWLQRAAEAAQDIEGRGKRVLFVGGTPLYLKALVHGLFAGPPEDISLRRHLARQAEEQGPEELHRRLQQADPDAAARLHPHDLRRVIRALEVLELTGKRISAWQQQWKATGGAGQGDRILCLDLPRRELYDRIDQRVAAMMETGLVEEVRRLRQLPRPISRQAAQALGYKEISRHLDGQLTLEQARAMIQTRSRNFAKRQLTWFRRFPDCRSIKPQLTFAAWRSTIA
jgi:tRNA dimethylallyltransferase